jgi:RNA recognition motif-containing protein
VILFLCIVFLISFSPRVSSAYFKTNTAPVSPIAALNENSLQSAQVHFSFVSKQNTYVVTEEVIRNIFRQFGEVKDVCIKKSVAHKESGGQSGYGFVHFPLNAEGVAAAIEATHVLCQILIDEVLYDCCLTHSLETFLKENYSSYSNSRSQEQFYNRPAHQQPPEIPPAYPSNFVGIEHGIPPAQQPQQHQAQQMRNNDYYAPFNQQQQHGQQQSFGYSNGLNSPPSLFTHQFQDPRSQSTGDYHQLAQQAQFPTARVQPQPQQQQTSAIPSFFEFVHHK